MPSQGLGQLIYIALVFLLTLSLLIVGQLFKKRKSIRYIFWTLSFLFLIGSIVAYNTKPEDEKKIEQKLAGVYYLDTDSSKYQDLNLKLYSDVTLTLQSNEQFFINKPTPFIKYLKGKWEYKDNGDFGYIDYSFDSLSLTGSVIGNLDIWTFGGYELNDPSNKNLIVFKRR